ncbi:rRNA-processing protein [Trichonephila clavata]|uniref:rRNA-processing protein UTP23 homolog n=1 Tax=Trichonephila clavata TaxID=2740835 RepID=A0A8X6L1W1_TRICU|nr:rRNA-processing protein [Trichonephila clavata]GFQ93409.1 rRNA-processing protein [Trichonephila clavata]
MKVKRQKQVKKCLNFYKNNFKFRAPFQVLVDSTFCHEALQSRVNLSEQIPLYLSDPKVKLCTTPCVITETEGLGHKVYGAMRIVKQFKVWKCGHEKDTVISAEKCILSLIGNNNPDNLIVATTDSQLIHKCRLIPGVPVMLLRYKAIILEKPSKVSLKAAQNKMKSATEVPAAEKALLEKMMPVEEETPIKKKRKAKNQNPLSCKKQKTELNPPTSQTSTGETKAKKKRLKKKAKRNALLSKSEKN